ncbi:MAG TPA: 2-phospho-L-lactate transferase [Acidimicrobiia bacterium]|nr:2-phospho-L-lactate transferase [Acidimicrobiia bacterium]
MRVIELSGGVGGARMARGLAAVEEVDLTVIVNVGDDAETHGLAISPDIDTVVYTLADQQGQLGWGRRDDTFHFNEELARFGVDNTFKLGDRDLALKVYRTVELKRSVPLSKVTESIVDSFGLTSAVIPATDDLLKTVVRVEDGWISFQEYFVARRYRDEVLDLRFEGAEDATPAPGVLESIAAADIVVIAPSNPPLSIWPILAVPGIHKAVMDHPRVTAVSPLIGGKTVKGPADRVLTSLGLPSGNLGIDHAYDGLIDTLVIDRIDEGANNGRDNLTIVTTETLMTDVEAARRLALVVLSL